MLFKIRTVSTLVLFSILLILSSTLVLSKPKVLTANQIAICTPDAIRFCKEEVLKEDKDAIRKCFIRNWSLVSKECKDAK